MTISLIGLIALLIIIEIFVVGLMYGFLFEEPQSNNRVKILLQIENEYKYIHSMISTSQTIEQIISCSKMVNDLIDKYPEDDIKIYIYLLNLRISSRMQSIEFLEIVNKSN